MGALFSRFLQPISRLERGEPIIDESAPPLVGPSLERLRTTASGLAGDVRQRVGQAVEDARSRRAQVSDSPAFTPTADDEETPSRLVSMLQGLTTTLSSWGASVTERIRGLWPSSCGRGPHDPTPSPVPAATDGVLDLPRLPPRRAPGRVDRARASPHLPRTRPRPRPVRPRWPRPAPGGATGERALDPPRSPNRGPSLPRPLRPRHRALRPAPARRQAPPPPTDDLEVVPFAEPLARREPDDLYDDGDGVGLGDVLRSTWAWAKVLVMLAVVVGGVAFAVAKWQTWFPTAAELGEATFTEVDRVARSRERAAEQQRALEQLTGELPHLAPETIRLILSRSPTGVLEAQEVFAIAGDATDRGFGTLTAEEATELDALGSELHERLGPLEREQLRDYALHPRPAPRLRRGARLRPGPRRPRRPGHASRAPGPPAGPPRQGDRGRPRPSPLTLIHRDR